MSYFYTIFISTIFFSPVLTFAADRAAAAPDMFDFNVKSISGEPVPLDTFRGKLSLIVNTASECGYTSQYGDLQEIYERYSSKGFTVLAFPSNDFGNQEPGSNKEIERFCSNNYQLSFPLFSKVQVKGGDKEPLFDFLTSYAPQPGEIAWNFEKFLVGPDGRVLARFKSPVRPNSVTITKLIEKHLPEKQS